MLVDHANNNNNNNDNDNNNVKICLEIMLRETIVVNLNLNYYFVLGRRIMVYDEEINEEPPTEDASAASLWQLIFFVLLWQSLYKILFKVCNNRVVQIP